jgi:glycosyltransferase involved in cell wall biosynthesis
MAAVCLGDAMRTATTSPSSSPRHPPELEPAPARRRPASTRRRVAIVHDYLNQCGGAERVALELARAWPGAPIYTSLYRPSSTFPGFAEREVRVSRLDRIPVDTGFRALAPLYPWAFRDHGSLSEDVVISSSSGWAHGVRTSPDTVHVVYCHTPARWLYRSDEHLGSSLGARLLGPLTRPLRRWDQAAARRADEYVANSEQVRTRIRRLYGRDAHVIYPPVDVERFSPRERGERLLVISRLLPYKRVDLIVRAATRAGIGLDVVGVGPSLDSLRAIAGPTVEFHGRVDDEGVVQLLQGCRALCVAATEDFGIVPVEANAAGKPVVAFAAGGVLETVVDGVGGALFDTLSEPALLAAIARADTIDTSPRDLGRLARRFSAQTFRSRMTTLVNDTLARSR